MSICRNAPSAGADSADIFRRLLAHLAGSLEDVVGHENAEGLIAHIGQSLGDDFDTQYREELKVTKLSRPQIADVLVRLKARMGGDFHVISESADRIVLGNRTCPFGDAVRDRPALCMLTSNVFGVIAAENLGYARVAIDESIAAGSSSCRVSIYLQPNESHPGRDYYATDS